MEPREESTDQQRIRQLVQDRAQAVRAKDLDGATEANASNVVTFDVLPPLRNVGANGIRERTERWFGGYPETPDYEIRDLQIVVGGGDVAFAYYLYHVNGTLANGDKVNMWVRATLGLQKQDGDWLIVHEHDSVPFDPESGKALIDLQP